MLLSEVIRITRQKAFLSQEEFAKVLDVSVSSITRWETGKTKPNLVALKKIKLFCEANQLSYDTIEKEWFSHSSEV